MTSTRFVGVDISKATFDVAFSADLRAVYSNDPAGFTQFRQAFAVCLKRGKLLGVLCLS